MADPHHYPLLTTTWRPWTLVGVLLAVVSGADFATGGEYAIFVFYFVPIAFAAWARGLGPAILVALVSSLLWIVDDLRDRGLGVNPSVLLWNFAVRLSSFMIVGWAFSNLSRLLASERARTLELRDALAKVRVLEGLLPICSACKKIRDEGGAWEPPEVYIHQRTDADFTHSYCPDCAAKLMEEFEQHFASEAKRSPTQHDEPDG